VCNKNRVAAQSSFSGCEGVLVVLDRDVAQEGDVCNDVDRLTGIVAQSLNIGLREILIELNVLLSPLTDALKEASLETLGIHENHVVLRVLEEGEILLEQLH
jgi:hypothetical protein